MARKPINSSKLRLTIKADQTCFGSIQALESGLQDLFVWEPLAA
jgi:hypothetical protein